MKQFLVAIILALASVCIHAQSNGQACAPSGATFSTPGGQTLVCSGGVWALGTSTPVLSPSPLNITGQIAATGCALANNVCTVGTATTNITFSNLPATATHLRIVVAATPSAATGLGVQFNGDTGSHYGWEYVQGLTATATASNSGAAGTLIEACNLANTAAYSSCTIDIPFYSIAQPSGKNVQTFSFANSLASGTTSTVRMICGTWSGTAAVNSVTLVTDNGATLSPGAVVSVGVY